MRRTRIKGIANIPQRKKNESTQNQCENDKVKAKEPSVNNGTSDLTDDPAVDLSAERKIIKEEVLSINGTAKLTPDQLEDTQPISILENRLLVGPNEGIDNSVPENQSVIDECAKIEEDEKVEQQNDVLVERETVIKSPLPLQSHTEPKKGSLLRVTILSDSEGSAPPPSPNKLNRSRIKAVPRIGQRKKSFSASESEDESKRMPGRKRNDSQCSSTSGTQDSVIEQPVQPVPKNKEFSTVIQRKCKRTEWSRKLAEARREFSRKFMKGKPDHKKLTMIDLIFYNPTTNTLQKTEKNKTESVVMPEEKEEDVDNPNSVEDEVPKQDANKPSEDENDDLPAPQIKIGPTGEIIIDEQSIVIESKETKKNREEMNKAQIVDGDDIDRPYGVVKKVKRCKDWSHYETLRFYKALNTLGTDFTMMGELFPNRTRRELKMKFKKEEKMNMSLIDKAITQPCGFNFEELKKEFELEDIERQSLIQQRQREIQMKQSKKSKKTSNFGQLFEGKNVGKQNPKKRKRLRKQQHPNKLKVLDVSSDTDSVRSDSNDEEYVCQPLQTRYGRKIRKRILFDIESDTDNEITIMKKTAKDENKIEPEQTQKPGSLMMVSSQSSDGQPVVQIFMVTDNVVNGEVKGNKTVNENLLPIALIRSDATEECKIVENNYTIPAEEDRPNDRENIVVIENVK